MGFGVVSGSASVLTALAKDRPQAGMVGIGIDDIGRLAATA